MAKNPHGLLRSRQRNVGNLGEPLELAVFHCVWREIVELIPFSIVLTQVWSYDCPSFEAWRVSAHSEGSWTHVPKGAAQCSEDQ
jgi:hypothetical protein